MVDKTFDKNSKDGSGVNNEIKHNQHLPDELHKPILKMF